MLSRAEFDKQMEGMNLFDASGEGVDLPDRIRDAVMLLLAWERERCAIVLGKAAEEAFKEAKILRHQGLANQHMVERGDILEFAEELIRRMKDA